ncbi:macrophage mannose receptor 1-like protein, partial [Aphelenchoides avenae]
MTCLRTAFSLLAALHAVSAKTYCPPDAFQGLTPNDCYTLGKVGRTSDESETVCAARGGHLASITSAFQNALLAKVAARGPTSYYQLGGRLVTGIWTWTDGSSFTYTNWAK